MNNIFAILSSTNKIGDIKEMWALCGNIICVRHSKCWMLKRGTGFLSDSVEICKNCHSFVCHDCIAKNREKCVMCADGENNYCEKCDMKSRKFICYMCGDNIYYECNCYVHFPHDNYGFICGECKKK